MTASPSARPVVGSSGGGPVLRTARPGGPSAASANPASSVPRTHLAARLENGFDRAVAHQLRRRGWTVRIEPYAGYGGTGWVRVLARTLLAAPQVRDDELPGAGSSAQAGARSASAVRGWRSFATAQVSGAELEVQVGDRTHTVVTDRGGYVDTILESDLAPGWHDVRLTTSDGFTATAPVHVIGPDVRYGIVSDIDDTVMVTRLPRPFVAAWNVFMRHENAREAVPGMARLYAELRSRDQDVPVVYLSTGAWNAAPTIARFLRRHRYPAGPLLLTDWGPTNSGWFRSGRTHKVTQLRRLFHELPDVQWILVGDDGQRDPQIYAGAAQRFGDHVRAILIRQLTFGEHVLAHGVPVPTVDSVRAEQQAAQRRDGIPVLQGADGQELLRDVRAEGLNLS
ncbi:App1 family protein [Cellulomonas humilata]|uniref:Phosphatidate phosphatase APP1 n=1 Tax=Cellulomonas humilata TaxID=144055 RepID=A0ABU0EH08_9CELL|nr:phosphatase domain-containing protein [Cellulomonas humilata]MDQ0374564.1 phosphatidate phosphatase APP1 [Cellulomonas humilata]